MAFVDIDKGEQNTGGETADDGTLVDKTTCLTDDSSATSCVEVKAGVSIRFESNHVPAAMSAVTVRIGVESIMAAGTLTFSAYTDFNTITTTAQVTTVSITGGGDVDTVITQALLDEIGTSIFTLRLREAASGAKIKTGELDIEFTVATIALSGVTKDKDGAALGSCAVALFRRTGTFPYSYEFVEALTSNVTTGAYTFNYEDDGANYMVYSMKEDTPHVFDAGDNVLQGV